MKKYIQDMEVQLYHNSSSLKPVGLVMSSNNRWMFCKVHACGYMHVHRFWVRQTVILLMIGEQSAHKSVNSKQSQ